MPPEETKHIPVNVYIALAISIAIIGCIGTMFSGAGQSFILLIWSKNTPEPTQTVNNNEATIQAAVNATLAAQSTDSPQLQPTNTSVPPTNMPQPAIASIEPTPLAIKTAPPQTNCNQGAYMPPVPSAPPPGCVLTVEWWYPPNPTPCGLWITNEAVEFKEGVAGYWWYEYDVTVPGHIQAFKAKDTSKPCEVIDYRNK